MFFPKDFAPYNQMGIDPPEPARVVSTRKFLSDFVNKNLLVYVLSLVAHGQFDAKNIPRLFNVSYDEEIPNGTPMDEYRHTQSKESEELVAGYLGAIAFMENLCEPAVSNNVVAKKFVYDYLEYLSCAFGVRDLHDYYKFVFLLSDKSIDEIVKCMMMNPAVFNFTYTPVANPDHLLMNLIVKSDEKYKRSCVESFGDQLEMMNQVAQKKYDLLSIYK